MIHLTQGSFTTTVYYTTTRCVEQPGRGNGSFTEISNKTAKGGEGVTVKGVGTCRQQNGVVVVGAQNGEGAGNAKRRVRAAGTAGGRVDREN